MRKSYTKILTLSGEYITRVFFMSLPFLCNCLFLQGERSLFFQLYCTFKFFRIRSWKRNFSGQGATPHLELTVEAGSTSRSGRTAPRELGAPRTGSTAPLSHSVAKRYSSHSSPAGPTATIRRWGGTHRGWTRGHSHRAKMALSH